MCDCVTVSCECVLRRCAVTMCPGTRCPSLAWTHTVTHLALFARSHPRLKVVFPTVGALSLRDCPPSPLFLFLFLLLLLPSFSSFPPFSSSSSSSSYSLSSLCCGRHTADGLFAHVVTSNRRTAALVEQALVASGLPPEAINLVAVPADKGLFNDVFYLGGQVRELSASAGLVWGVPPPCDSTT